MIALPELGLAGRLGNQLFQFAAAYAYSLHNSQKLIVRACELTDHIQGDWLATKMVPMMDIRWHEKSFAYAPIPPGLNNVSLYGYFQSWKHFADCEDAIRNAVMPETSIVTPNKATAVHVRRGDYLQKSHYHTNLPIDYYLMAMDLIPGPYAVFSDDPAWCKEAFKGRSDVHVVDEPDAWETLYSMASCERHIIANSSLSWWGAWLSGSREVVAPAQWFVPKELNDQTGDLCPEEWVRI